MLHGSLDDADVARIWTMLDESGLAVPVDVVRYEAMDASSLRDHIDRYARPLFDRSALLEPSERDRRNAAT